MREHFSYKCKDISDHAQKELKPDEINDIFEKNYLNLKGDIEVRDFEISTEVDGTIAQLTIVKDG